jgi:hypothetical protein
MRRRATRGWLSLLVAVGMSTVSACAFVFPHDSRDDCAVRPVSALRHLVGPAVARATTCALIVMVDGQRYTGGVEGAWLYEDAVRIEEFGRVTEANVPIANPTAYRMVGIDPKRMLVIKGVAGRVLGVVGSCAGSTGRPMQVRGSDR